MADESSKSSIIAWEHHAVLCVMMLVTTIIINCNLLLQTPFTHTNLYTHYTPSATMASKESTVRTLTRTAFKLCSPCHLQTELLHLESTFLSNGYPLRKIRNLMDQTLKRLKSTASDAGCTRRFNIVIGIAITLIN